MPKAPKNIAEAIIARCGGVARVAEITGRTHASVYKWTYSKENGGTGGSIPRKAQLKILAAAKTGIVNVSPHDFFEAA